MKNIGGATGVDAPISGEHRYFIFLNQRGRVYVNAHSLSFLQLIPLRRPQDHKYAEISLIFSSQKHEVFELRSGGPY